MDITCKIILEALCKGFKPDGAGDWKTLIQFNFSGEKGGDFYLKIEDQKCTLSEGTVEKPTASVKAADQVWIDISLGKLNPMMAFMSGKVSVGGHMGDIMKLNDKKVFDVKKS